MMNILNRRHTLALLMASLAGPALAVSKPAVTVHRSPSCGCCGGWAGHLRSAGYVVTIIDEADLAPIKTKAGVPDALQSCHTAFIDGYVVEGHVPLEAIERMLTERPALRGIAVPGMPTGSPGMEMPDMKPEAFTVMGIPREGLPTTYMDFPNGYRGKS